MQSRGTNWPAVDVASYADTTASSQWITGSEMGGYAVPNLCPEPPRCCPYGLAANGATRLSTPAVERRHCRNIHQLVLNQPINSLLTADMSNSSTMKNLLKCSIWQPTLGRRIILRAYARSPLLPLLVASCDTPCCTGRSLFPSPPRTLTLHHDLHIETTQVPLANASSSSCG